MAQTQPAAWRVFAIVLLGVSCWWILPIAVRYSAIWNLQVHPRPNVEVTLKSGVRLTGDYSRTWDGDMSIRTADGAEHRFREFAVMSNPMPSLDEREGLLARKWRAWALPVLVMLIHVAVLVLLAWPMPDASARRVRPLA